MNVLETWPDVSDLLSKVSEHCSEPIKTKLIAIQTEFKEKQIQHELDRKQQDELIAKCHPEGKHWPPHEECPICLKIFKSVVTLASLRCKDPNNEAEMLEKFDEVFNELYLTKKE